MTFEDLKNANAAIQTTDIKGKQYAEVNQRIKAFRMVYPDGTIETEIISLEDGVCTMKATVKNIDIILGTGHAQEKESSSFINKTSYIENCETSAVGRALGMCGFGIDTSVASYEEVANAIENQNKPAETKITKAQIRELRKKEIELNIPESYLMGCFKIDKLEDMTQTAYKKTMDNLPIVQEKAAEWIARQNS